MNIAFYAPLKSPNHPLPSGDRRMARLLMRALRQTGAEVNLACEFRSWEGHGDLARQDRLRRIGEALADRWLRRYRFDGAGALDCWFTYHLYHKAPDWFGPRVSRTLGIPYVVAEASYAPKQAEGPWSSWHREVARAVHQARAIVSLNPTDVACLLPCISPGTRMVKLAPFLEDIAPCGDRDEIRHRLAKHTGLDPGRPWLLSVAMMRAGDKLASYLTLADALREIEDCAWELIVVGDGPRRRQVEAAFEMFGPRVRFLGELDPDELHEIYSASDVCVWPAVNEAYGMALLEAQARGLPVVAGDYGGVSVIVEHNRTGLVTRPGDVCGFGRSIAALLADTELRQRLGRMAKEKVASQHTLGSATACLGPLLASLQ